MEIQSNPDHLNLLIEKLPIGIEAVIVRQESPEAARAARPIPLQAGHDICIHIPPLFLQRLEIGRHDGRHVQIFDDVLQERRGAVRRT